MSRLYVCSPIANQFERQVVDSLLRALESDESVVAGAFMRWQTRQLGEVDGILLLDGAIVAYEAKAWAPAAGQPLNADRWRVHGGQENRLKPSPIAQLAGKLVKLRRQVARLGLDVPVEGAIVVGGRGVDLRHETHAGDVYRVISLEHTARLAAAARRVGTESTWQSPVLGLLGANPGRPRRIGPFVGVQPLEHDLSHLYHAYRARSSFTEREVYVRVIAPGPAVGLAIKHDSGDVPGALWRRGQTMYERFERDPDLAGSLLTPVPVSDPNLTSRWEIPLAYEWTFDNSLVALACGATNANALGDVLRKLAIRVDRINARGPLLRGLAPGDVVLENDEIRLVGADWGHDAEVRTALPDLRFYARALPSMAPEVRSGAQPHSASADVFSVAAIAHWLLCGEHPPLDDPARLARELAGVRGTALTAGLGPPEARPSSAQTLVESLLEA